MTELIVNPIKENVRKGKFISSFVFNGNINVISTIAKDISLLNSFLNKNKSFFNYYPNISSISKYFKVGAELAASTDGPPFILKIKNIVETEYFHSISWEGRYLSSSEPLFTCDFNFHYINDSKTNFFSVYTIPVLSDKSTDMIFRQEEKKRKEYYMIINNFLISKQYLRIQTEIFKTKGTFSFSKKLLSNVEIMTKLMGELMYSSNQQYKNGTKTIVKLPKEKIKGKSELVLKVRDIQKSNNRFLIKASISYQNIYFNNEMTFELICHENNYILIVFTNKFNYQLTERELRSVSNTKVKILEKFNQILSKQFSISHNNT